MRGRGGGGEGRRGETGGEGALKLYRPHVGSREADTGLYRPFI